jgi:membrane peptidoglycan carboxypeptidase
MNKLKTLAVYIRSCFWRPAGVVPQVLQQCPINHARYTAIGSSKGAETSLLDMVSAYTVFSNQGIRVKPATNKFYLQNDQKFIFPKSKAERMASIESANKTNAMMKLVLNEIGTAPNFKRAANLANNSDVSGKTGTGMWTDFDFFAVTPKIVVGVWVGLPQNEIPLTMEQGFTGGKIAAPVVAKFLQTLQTLTPDCF